MGFNSANSKTRRSSLRNRSFSVSSILLFAAVLSLLLFKHPQFNRLFSRQNVDTFGDSVDSDSSSTGREYNSQHEVISPKSPGGGSSFREVLSNPEGNPAAAEKKRNEKEAKDPTKKAPVRHLNLTGVHEYTTTVRQDWHEVIKTFLEDSPPAAFSARIIRAHYESGLNNVKKTCMLVTIRHGNVTYQEGFPSKRHGRASSVKYVLEKIVKEKGTSMPGMTFLVMLTDGHKPAVPTFGSARHWENWRMMIPVPLGNSRGVKEEWGTPLKGWDTYIDKFVIASHKNYTWESKMSKALFRGALCMQSYILGSCNARNNGRCTRATRWHQVNRGVLYMKSVANKDILDVGFTSLKPKMGSARDQFENAPEPVGKMKFQDYQKYKLILNVGSNQGKLFSSCPVPISHVKKCTLTISPFYRLSVFSDWAERLRSLLFMNSAVVMHHAETKEFFTPLLQPWVHVIPTDLHFTDLVANINWATNNDAELRQIVRNQNAFAERYISERSMRQYWEVALDEFAKRQTLAAGEKPNAG